MGYRAGFTMTTGSYNTFLGQRAGESKTGGDRNTFLGSNAGSGNSAGSDNVFLGYQAGSLSGDVSNKLYIANTSTNTPLIYGDFSTNNVGLGTNAPGSNRLKVINAASGINRAQRGTLRTAILRV
jgi:trimeric autotransporter adhesin